MGWGEGPGLAPTGSTPASPAALPWGAQLSGTLSAPAPCPRQGDFLRNERR